MKNLNIVKRGSALLVAGATLFGLTACSGKTEESSADKKTCVLDGTLLEGTVLADVDGDYEILGLFLPASCHNLEKEDQLFGDSRNKEDHNHYYNVVTGEVITEGKNCDKVIVGQYHYAPRKVHEVNVLGEITDYLTQDELTKAAKDELTEDDMVEIVTRVNDMQPANQKVKK